MSDSRRPGRPRNPSKPRTSNRRAAKPNQPQHEPSRAALLEDLLERSGSLTVLLISKDGTESGHAGDTSYFDTDAMSALVAGMFSATREVARMVGEDQFSILLQQGQNRHIHISLVTDTLMMVLIFEDYQRIGRVRHEARRTAERLAELLQTQDDTQTSLEDRVSVPAFKEYALNLIDRIFATK